LLCEAIQKRDVFIRATVVLLPIYRQVITRSNMKRYVHIVFLGVCVCVFFFCDRGARHRNRSPVPTHHAAGIDRRKWCEARRDVPLPGPPCLTICSGEPAREHSSGYETPRCSLVLHQEPGCTDLPYSLLDSYLPNMIISPYESESHSNRGSLYIYIYIYIYIYFNCVIAFNAYISIEADNNPWKNRLWCLMSSHHH